VTLEAGRELLHYHLVEQIGQGGMGVVWKASDTRLDRAVAIKVLPAHLSEDETLRARFEREARAISQLNHPHICTLHDIGRDEGIDFIVMEFLDGKPLIDRLLEGSIPLAEALRHGIHIARALHEAHRAGLVHRDLKPGNIMLTRSGVKLLDFGLAKLVTEPARPLAEDTPTATLVKDPMTQEGTILGTLHYAAPEQLEGKEVDSRTDVFALGCVLHEMITGERAFDGPSQAAVISAVMNADPPPVSRIHPDTPPQLDHLVAKCLAKNPDDRWHSAADLAGQLEWIEQSSSSVSGPPVSQSVPQPAAPVPSPAADYRIEYFDSADGAVIAAARGGSGKPLLVVPLMVDSIETKFSEYAAAFPNREVITYDRRGTALSERGTGFKIAEPYFQDAQAVVDGFELECFDVVGTLMGSIEAAAVSARCGSRVDRLVLRLPLMGLDDWSSIPPVSAALAAMEKDWVFFTESISQMVVGWGRPGSMPIAERFRTVTTKDELRSMFDAFVNLNLESIYPEITAKTLLEHNPGYFFPATYSRRIASLIPDCTMVIFNGASETFLADYSAARDFLAEGDD
jgi:serine/threonine protein kinase